MRNVRTNWMWCQLGLLSRKEVNQASESILIVVCSNGQSPHFISLMIRSTMTSNTFPLMFHRRTSAESRVCWQCSTSLSRKAGLVLVKTKDWISGSHGTLWGTVGSATQFLRYTLTSKSLFLSPLYFLYHFVSVSLCLSLFSFSLYLCLSVSLFPPLSLSLSPLQRYGKLQLD